MTNEEMRHLRMIEIDILDYIVDICEKNSLSYFLLYGTLLGAVRHKGFIPWDDDIDIGLLRKDYEILCAILTRQCNEEGSIYFFQNPNTDISFKLPFSKLRRRGTRFVEEHSSSAEKQEGIFVDIFPLDKVKHIRGIQKPFSFLIYRLLQYTTSTNCRILLPIVQQLSTWYENKDCDYYVSYGSAYPVERDICKCTWFSETRLMTFEGKKYCVPSEYEEYLSTIYGSDYMEVPPPDKRVCHDPLLIDFGNEKLR